MYRASLTEGFIEADAYEMDDRGVELYTEDGELMAFVPYQNLVALTDLEVYPHEPDELSVM